MGEDAAEWEFARVAGRYKLWLLDWLHNNFVARVILIVTGSKGGIAMVDLPSPKTAEEICHFTASEYSDIIFIAENIMCLT